MVASFSMSSMSLQQVSHNNKSSQHSMPPKHVSSPEVSRFALVYTTWFMKRVCRAIQVLLASMRTSGFWLMLASDQWRFCMLIPVFDSEQP